MSTTSRIASLEANKRQYLPHSIIDAIYEEAKAAGYKCLGAAFVIGDKTDLIFDEDHDGLSFVLKREFA